jgi:uncharacterized repeat protein (TIGR03803 family)
MTNAQGYRGWAAVMVAAILMTMAAAIATPAQRAVPFANLHSFENADGASPQTQLVQATDGNFYGTTFGGGANGDYGTVFKIAPTGALTTLHSFCPQHACTDGFEPNALVEAVNGGFYGTTVNGGDHGQGTVFSITGAGILTTLYAFCPAVGCDDGRAPSGALVQTNDGNFYGTTSLGGVHGDYGTVFKISPGGVLTTLYSFCSQVNCADGSYPAGGLIQATDGNLYGTAQGGGAYGYGIIFRIALGGSLTTVHSFDSTDGAGPLGGLIQAPDGNLFGATLEGGTKNYGTLFQVTTSGTLTRLHSFCAESHCADGAYPEGGLIQATDGSFYGTTSIGGIGFNWGTIFRITPEGTLTTLHSFQYADGVYPYAALIQSTNGNFYGTTLEGGASLYGTVFGLSVGLGPFVETQPTSGRTGAIVKILGTNLTGAASVTFNGSPATFKVVSSSLISTTVPTGATTGPVLVVTPSGTLTSNVNFQVLP